MLKLQEQGSLLEGHKNMQNTIVIRVKIILKVIP